MPKKGAILPEEHLTLSAILYGSRAGIGWNKGSETVDFFDIKGLLEKLFSTLGISGVEYNSANNNDLFHPVRCASVSIGGSAAGYVGELHPDVAGKYDLKGSAAIFELDMGVVERGATLTKRFIPLPRFPESARDIAFIVDEEVEFAYIIEAVRGADVKLIENIELFDVYYGGQVGEGKKSLAIRVTYRSMDRTLKNEEVDKLHAVVIKTLEEKFKAKVRM